MVACSCLVSASSSPTVAHRMTSFSYANDTRTANTNRTVTETAIVQGPLAMDRKFMEEATRPAIESVEKGWGGPFGAVIVRDGEIIGRRPAFYLPDARSSTPRSRRSSMRQANPKILLGSDHHAAPSSR